jgi:CRISPR-associated endonuclease/helicase Cas3
MEVSGPEELESLKRYRRSYAADSDDPLPEVATALREHRSKVLWVCNTVNRAMEAADRAAAAGLKPLLYHSRFRYVDRVQRHAEVIDAFKCDRPVLAVCTQVAEMSLDLSASMLVTDLAPVASMIQRLGRLNRRALPPQAGEPVPPPMPFVVVEPLGSLAALPYRQDEVALARRWLANIGDGDLCQRDLADAWSALESGDAELPVESAWLDGGPQTHVVELRTASPGLTVILEPDLASLDGASADPLEVALPMPPPRRLNWRKWRAYKGIPVAPSDAVTYDPRRGGQWRE